MYQAHCSTYGMANRQGGTSAYNRYGGIASAADAIEFLLAGATAVQVGCYNFVDPAAASYIVDGIEDYLRRHGISDVKELIGSLVIEHN